MRTVFAVLFFACSATAEPIALRISRTYTHVEFTINKWSVLRQEGSFRDCSGEIVLDADHPARSQVHLAVQLASIDTRNSARDRALLGEDFFDAQHYPVMTFASATIVPGNSKDAFDVTGALDSFDLRLRHQMNIRGLFDLINQVLRHRAPQVLAAHDDLHVVRVPREIEGSLSG